MSSWPAIAAANNAEWCNAACRTHGIDAEVDGNAWTSRTRTPPLYPDAVTLLPDPSRPELLARINASPGCSRWRGEHGPLDVLRADLLRMQSVTVLAAHLDDRIVGGAVLTQGAAVVGISNFFSDPTTAPTSWPGCLALVSALFPGATLVGYESGNALDEARMHGFDAVGPLRVWVHDG